MCVCFPKFALEVDLSSDCYLSYKPLGATVEPSDLDYNHPKPRRSTAARPATASPSPSEDVHVIPPGIEALDTMADGHSSGVMDSCDDSTSFGEATDKAADGQSSGELDSDDDSMSIGADRGPIPEIFQQWYYPHSPKCPPPPGAPKCSHSPGVPVGHKRL